MIKHALIPVSVFALLSVAVQPVQAAGFYIQEQSATYQGLSFAGAAADPVDASTIYYNPAGMTYLDTPQLSTGASLIVPYARLRDEGSTAGTAATGFAQTSFSRDSSSTNPYDPTPVPHFFVAIPASEDKTWWLGFGVSAPFGLSNEYDNDFWGRYDSTQTSLSVIDYQPSIAWKPNNWLSVGGGLDYQRVEASLDNAIPSPATAGGPTPATDGVQNLSGEGSNIGFNLGAILQPTDTTRIGLTYRSQVNHDLQGRIIIRRPLGVAGGGTSVRIGGDAELALPDFTTLAVSQDIGDKWTVQGHYIRFNWSVFDDIPVGLDNGGQSSTFQNYKDTNAFAIGAKYKMDPEWTFMAGYQYDATPTTDGFRTTRTPDGDRNWFSAGAEYKYSDTVTLNLSGTYIRVGSEDINLTRSFPTVGNSSVQVRGSTESDIGILALGLSYKF